MPHKHKRGENKESDYELPPDSVARPLTTSKTANVRGTGKPGNSKPKDVGNSKKRKRIKEAADDTPKAFVRLMAFQQGMKPRSGLDNGTKQARSKAQKTKTSGDGSSAANAVEANSKAAATPLAIELPSLLPGERLADFSARVDAALPLSRVSKGKKVKLEGVKRHRTRLEKKITRMQDEWREREQRIKEKEAEVAEEEEIGRILDGEDDRGARHFFDEDLRKGELSLAKGKKGRKKRAKGNTADDSDDDPWAVVAKARKESETAKSGLIGLHDTVQAPPKLDVKPKEKFKIRNGAKVDIENVPVAAGSLRRREELSEARRSTLEGYKKMVEARQTAVLS